MRGARRRCRDRRRRLYWRRGRHFGMSLRWKCSYAFICPPRPTPVRHRRRGKLLHACAPRAIALRVWVAPLASAVAMPICACMAAACRCFRSSLMAEAAAATGREGSSNQRGMTRGRLIMHTRVSTNSTSDIYCAASFTQALENNIWSKFQKNSGRKRHTTACYLSSCDRGTVYTQVIEMAIKCIQLPSISLTTVLWAAAALLSVACAASLPEEDRWEESLSMLSVSSVTWHPCDM